MPITVLFVMVQKDKQRMWRNVYLLVNVIGLLVFIGVGFLFSKKKKDIDWRSVLIMLVINLVLAWFLTSFSVGRDIVLGAATGLIGSFKLLTRGLHSHYQVG